MNKYILIDGMCREIVDHGIPICTLESSNIKDGLYKVNSTSWDPIVIKAVKDAADLIKSKHGLFDMLVCNGYSKYKLYDCEANGFKDDNGNVLIDVKFKNAMFES